MPGTLCVCVWGVHSAPRPPPAVSPGKARKAMAYGGWAAGTGTRRASGEKQGAEGAAVGAGAGIRGWGAVKEAGGGARGGGGRAGAAQDAAGEGPRATGRGPPEGGQDPGGPRGLGPFVPPPAPARPCPRTFL